MTRFVVGAGTVLRLASAQGELPGQHELLAPTLLRSQTLSVLHEAVHRGEIASDVARERLARTWRMPIRLLGDAVLRRRAWDLAEQLGQASTYNAEYVALTLLQADAFITLDADLARSLEGIVRTAPIAALLQQVDRIPSSSDVGVCLGECADPKLARPREFAEPVGWWFAGVRGCARWSTRRVQPRSYGLLMERLAQGVRRRGDVVSRRGRPGR